MINLPQHDSRVKMEQDWTGAVVHVGLRGKHLLQALTLVDAALDVWVWPHSSLIAKRRCIIIFLFVSIATTIQDMEDHADAGSWALTVSYIRARRRKVMENNNPLSPLSVPAVSL